MISQKQLDMVRQRADEFRQLTDDGDFSVFAVVNRYSQLSAQLSLLVPDLLDEIERLQRDTPAVPEHVLKMDRQGGVA